MTDNPPEKTNSRTVEDLEYLFAEEMGILNLLKYVDSYAHTAAGMLFEKIFIEATRGKSPSEYQKTIDAIKPYAEMGRMAAEFILLQTEENTRDLGQIIHLIAGLIVNPNIEDTANGMLIEILDKCLQRENAEWPKSLERLKKQN
ncbi:MAG: hypothetical protein LBC63_02480 [Holophagales bacterium]|nr:hypothetical protein [Holophagales bacterium]